MKHTEMVMVIEAHSEGKAIQSLSKSSSTAWRDADSNGEFNFIGFNYRVKPTPIYATLKGQYPSQTIAGSGKWVDVKALEVALNMVVNPMLDVTLLKELRELIK